VHADRLSTIRDVYSRHGLMIDTHTADGVKVAREHWEPGVPMIVLETALPAKFSETLREALGRDAERPAGFEHIESLPQRFDVMEADVAAIKTYIAAHTGL
jgi:threonine synthase